MEYKTTSSSTQETERILAVEGDGSAQACVETTKWLDNNTLNGRYYLYDRDAGGGSVAANKRFSNQSDLNEYDFGAISPITYGPLETDQTLPGACVKAQGCRLKIPWPPPRC
jgi:hypothetical protein